MKKRTLVAVALAVVFVLSLAVPAFAQSITHTASYNLDGDIELEKEVGHVCNTGAAMKQEISGQGKMVKVMAVEMVQGKLTVSDSNDFVTAPDAVRNLVVTSVIQLCAPGKYTYDDGVYDGFVHPGALYGVNNQPAVWFGAGWARPDNGLTTRNTDEEVNFNDYDAVSTQIWAAQVEAAPGFSGKLDQDFVAAYGPYEGSALTATDREILDETHWAWENNEFDIVRGDTYVGNYFTMEQFARTSQGVVSRYIDISSPFSHAWLYVDSVITGMAEVKESFEMDNIGEGDDAAGAWWDLF